MSRIDFFALSERGLRHRNDDAYCAEQIGDYFVFALADGLAGHRYGDMASKIAVDALKGAVKNTPGSAQDILAAGVRKADADIRDLSLSSPKHAGLATTLVACLIDKKMACTVLDTANKNCTVITKSAIEDVRHAALVRHLPGSRAEPHTSPKPPLITDMISHALGEPHRLKETDFSSFILGNEFLLLSSDGLTDVLPKETIAAIVRNNEDSPEAACQTLVQEAMKAGSEGTITVILVHGTEE
jgi:protein phosphatase